MTLKYKPVMWFVGHAGARTENDPAFRYEVSDEKTARTVGYITNDRATGHAPCWKISRLNRAGRITESTGEYVTAEAAFAAMEPHWVNICEREPEMDKEVQVLVVKLGKDIGYASARPTKEGWVFLTEPISTQIVAWLESNHFLSEKEISEVPKDRIRFG